MSFKSKKTYNNGKYEELKLVQSYPLYKMFKVLDVRDGSKKILILAQTHDPKITKQLELLRQLINNTYIVKICDYFFEDKKLIIITPYYKYRNLESIINEHRQNPKNPIPTTKILEWAEELLNALNKIHAKSIMHRDLRPKNLLIDSFGSIILVNFGVTSDPETMNTYMKESRFYMSPELHSNKKNYDSKTDIWSFGCIIYELVTCQKAFDGTHLVEIASKIIDSKITMPNVDNPKIAYLIRHSIVKNPDERKSSSEMLNFLRYGEPEMATNPSEVAAVIDIDTDKILDLYREGDAKLKVFKYQEALKCLMNAQDLAERAYGAEQDNEMMANILDKIGLVYSKLNKWPKALENFMRAFDIRKKLNTNIDEREIVVSLMNIGDCHLSSNLPEKSTAFYIEAYDVATRMVQENDEAKNLLLLAECLRKLGTCYLKLHRDREALEYCKQSLDILTNHYKYDDHESIASVLLTMGKIHNNLNESRTGLEYNLRSVSIRERLKISQGSVANDCELANALSGAGVSYFQLGMYKNSFEYFSKSLAMLEAIYRDQDHGDLAYAYNYVGVTYDKLKDYHKALEHKLKARQMRGRLFDESDHPELATSLNSVGIAYFKLNDFKTSLDYYMKALRMRERLHNYKDHLDISDSLNNIGHSYEKLLDFQRSLENFMKSLKMRERLFKGRDHAVLATSYHNVGLCYEYLNDYDSSLDYKLNALEMRERLYKFQEHTDLADSLYAVGFSYENLNKLKTALNYYLKAYDMREKLNRKPNQRDDENMALVLSRLAKCYFKLGHHQTSLEHFLKLYQLRKQSIVGDHLDVADTLNDIGECYDKLNDLRTSLDYFLNSMKMKERLIKGNHPSLAESYSNVASVYEKLGLIDSSLDYFLKALRIREHFDAENDKMADTLENVGNIYSQMGVHDSAIIYLVKSYKLKQKLLDNADNEFLVKLLKQIAKSYSRLNDTINSLKYEHLAENMLHRLDRK